MGFVHWGKIVKQLLSKVGGGGWGEVGKIDKWGTAIKGGCL